MENIVYHGSNVEVVKPRIIQNGFYKDFGFYCTNIEKQAKRWALTRHGDSIISKYTYTFDAKLNTMLYKGMTEEWLQFVVNCRRGINHSYDVVEGSMADDQIWDYVEDYVCRKISKNAFWELVKFKYPTHQIAFCTEEALKALRFEGSDTI